MYLTPNIGSQTPFNKSLNGTAHCVGALGLTALAAR